MFAYCLNNPVNLVDKNGETADSWAGWIGEQLTEWLYELFTGETHPNKQTRELENQIITQQNEMLADAVNTVWNAHVHSTELQMQAQYEKDMKIRKVGEYFLNDPVAMADLVVGSLGFGTTYIGYAAAGAGISIPVAGQIALGVAGTVFSLWGLFRLIQVALES